MVGADFNQLRAGARTGSTCGGVVSTQRHKTGREFGVNGTHEARNTLVSSALSRNVGRRSRLFRFLDVKSLRYHVTPLLHY